MYQCANVQIPAVATSDPEQTCLFVLCSPHQWTQTYQTTVCIGLVQKCVYNVQYTQLGLRATAKCKEENSFGLGRSIFFSSNIFLDIVLCVLEGTHPPCISWEIPRQVAALFPFSQEIPPTSPSTSPALYIFPASSNFSWFPPNSHPPHFNNTPLYYVSCLLKWFLILPFSREISLFPNLLYPVFPNFPLIFSPGYLPKRVLFQTSESSGPNSPYLTTHPPYHVRAYASPLPTS